MTAGAVDYDAEPAVAARALARQRDALAARRSDDGVWFGSRARLVTAGRR